MDILDISVKLLLSLILGAVIGLEREINEKKSTSGKKTQAILGLRSFSLMTTMGAVAGLLYPQSQSLSLLLTGGFLLLSIVFYAIDTLLTRDNGITTELAMVLSYFIGLLIALETFPTQVTIAMAVVLILILSRKKSIKNVVDDIQKDELNAFIGYAIIALVILPFLPNTSYSVSDIKGLQEFLKTAGVSVQQAADIELFNPFKLWLIVALITGIDIVGYILERTIGQKKGWILASIAGGFVSSTATTQSLAQQSKSSKRINHLLAAALVSNLVSFFQIAILLSPINANFVIRLIPTFIAIIVAALAVTIYFIRSKEKQSSKVAKEKVIKDESILEIKPALKFAVLYLFISIFSKLALTFFGGGAFLLATALGALAGLDAVMINTAQLAGGRIDWTLAVWAFIIANAVNLIGKIVYSYLQGKKEFATKFAISVVIIIAASLVGILFV